MKRQLLIAFTGALALGAVTTSCVKEKETGGQDPAEVRFTGNLAEIKTRVGGADGTLWDANDPVGVYMIKADPAGLNAGNVLAANKQYKAAAGASAAFTPADGTPLHYPADGGSVKFVAYYPHGAVTDYKVQVSVAAQSDLSKIDVLYAATEDGYNKTATAPVSLPFAHKLTKLVFNVANGANVTEPVANGITVSVSNQQTKGTLDLADDGEITPSGAAGIVSASGGATIEAIVLPKNDLTGVEFTFTNAAGQTFTVAVPTDKWRGGYRYTYTVTLKGADKQSDIEGDIDQWNDGGTTPVTGKEAAIKLPDPSEKNLAAFADDESAGSFTFTATGAWTASVSGLTRAGGSGVSWVRLFCFEEETYSGGAGTFTFIVKLEPNYTGAARAAVITIVCGGETVTITVEQAPTTESGVVLQDPVISLYTRTWVPTLNTGETNILSIHKNGIIFTGPDYSYKLGDLTWERAVNDIEATGRFGEPDSSEQFPVGYKITGTLSDITGYMMYDPDGPKPFTPFKPYYGIYGNEWATEEGDRAVLWVYLDVHGGTLGVAREDSLVLNLHLQPRSDD